MKYDLGQYDVIVFDLWEVLLVPPGLDSKDYLRILENKYELENLRCNRIKLQEEYNENNSCQEYNYLKKVYDDLSDIYNWNFYQTNNIYLEEINILKKTVQIRKTYDLLLKKKNDKKNCYIIVNTNYLDEYVSKIIIDEYKLEKYASVLFFNLESNFDEEAFLIEQFKNKKILVFGNNICVKKSINNIKNNYKFEVDYEYVPSVVEILKKHRKLGQLFNNIGCEFDDCFFVGHSALRMFDNPNDDYSDETYFDGKESFISNYLFAPFFFIFTKWMLEDCLDNNIETLVYVYRDGYLIENIHRILEECMDRKVSVSRIYLTRAISNIMYANKRNPLYHSVTNNLTNANMSVKDFILTRLNVSERVEYDEVLNIFLENGYAGENDLLKKREKYIRFIKEISPYFEKNFKDKISVLKKYCYSIFGQLGKSAVFDVGYRGSACKLLKGFGIDTIGYHLFAKGELEKNNCEDVNVKSLIKFGLETERSSKLINVLTEDILNAPEPTVVDIDIRNGEIVLFKDKYWEELKVIPDIQKDIIDYSKSFVEAYGKYIWDMELDVYSYFEFYVRFLKSSNNKDRMIFNDVIFSDSAFMNSNANNVYSEWIGSSLNNTSLKIGYKSTHDIVPHCKRSKVRTKAYNMFNRWGVLPMAKKVWYKWGEISQVLCRGSREVKNSVDGARVVAEMQKSIKEIEIGLRYRIKPHVIVCGHIVAFDKGTCNYINTLAREMGEYDWLLLSECPHVDENTINKKIDIDYKVLRKVPMKNDYDANVDMPISYDIKNLIDSKAYLREAVDCMEKRFPDMGLNYASYLTWYLYCYYNKIIDLYSLECSPIIFLVWNEFTTMHRVLKGVCNERGEKIIFMEFGVIPGTFNLDVDGQMGESRVSLFKDEFESLDVSYDEIERMSEILEQIRIKGENRNVQPQNDQLDIIKKQLLVDRPIVLYLGQNDFEAGMYPYNSNTKKYHSPFYRTSDEAAKSIERICIKNGYNFIYKPHPTMFDMYGCKQKFEKSTIVVNDVNINDLIDISDVCCTILSQSAYISLIRKKPVVMLGYTQLKDRDFVYQLDVKNNLESIINKAIINGYGSECYKGFVEHCTRLNKYYLFDDLVERSFSLGRPLKEFKDYIKREMCINERKTPYSLKVAICSQMPDGKYSGGRSHAWNIGEALAMTGNRIYFLANNEPVFKDAMIGQFGHDNIRFIKTNDYSDVLINERELDYVFLIPHRDTCDVYYKKVWNLAIKKNAKLILVNYESANWVNEYLGNQFDEKLWGPWISSCKLGCLVLSSDRESQKYAVDFYKSNPKNTYFDYWYPPINSFLADKVTIKNKTNQIVTLIRLSDKYKGSFDVLDMINEDFRGYKFVFIYGSYEQNDTYQNYVKRLEYIKDRYGISYEIKLKISDMEKFEIIAKSKLLLFPSYFEGYGTPPIEALYCQTDCVAYDLPVLRETCGSSITYAKYGDINDLRIKAISVLKDYIPNSEKKESIYEVADFNMASKKLNDLLKKYESFEWRDINAKTTE